MRIYETTFIVNPQTDNASIDQNVRAVADLISANGGKIIKEDHMGTRRLAYPIAGLTQGYYATFYFEAEPKVLPVLERHFKLEDPYVRHLLIRFDGDPKWLEPDEQGPEESTVEHRRPAGGGRRPEADGDKTKAGPPETTTAEKTPAASAAEQSDGETKPADASEDKEPVETATSATTDSPGEPAESDNSSEVEDDKKEDLTSGGEL